MESATIIDFGAYQRQQEIQHVEAHAQTCSAELSQAIQTLIQQLRNERSPSARWGVFTASRGITHSST